ncbi:MAG: DUF3999 domain-containing protein [Dokdonella sp.]|uniref:DUF3999 domain-containing protein n=1 Tax=Dokdonella sp. TaxID=2291710 RepID=UPI003263434F
MNAGLRWTLALTCAVISPVRAATPADFAWTFSIETDATSPAASAWRVELTPDVYAWVQERDLRDIEVFNAAGVAVPIGRWQPEPAFVTREQTVVLPVLALPASAPRASTSDLRLVIDRDADGRLRRIDAGEQARADTGVPPRDWLLDASRFDLPIDRLALTWSAPASGVVARFSIEASNDLQQWHAAGDGTVLALEQDGSRLERHDIEVSGVYAKYVRLHRLDDGTPVAGLSAQAHSSRRSTADATRSWLDVPIASGSASATPVPPGTERYDYALLSALPVEVARIELANDNALAPLVFSARASDATTWSELSRITAFRLRSGVELLRNGDVAVSTAARLRDFRIESSVPLAAAPRLVIAYRPDTLVFLAEGSGPYLLAVGSLRAHHASYPVDAALASLRARLGKEWQPPLARLGAGSESGGISVLAPLPLPTPWRRWLLWGVLVAAAALVGGIAAKLLRGNRPH